jgi:hypothetical protein
LCNLALAFIANEKVHVIGGDHVGQYANPESLSGLDQPAQVDCPVAGKLEQEFALMAPVGDVPDMAGQEEAVGARHCLQLIKVRVLAPHPKR